MISPPTSSPIGITPSDSIKNQNQNETQAAGKKNRFKSSFSLIIPSKALSISSKSDSLLKPSIRDSTRFIDLLLPSGNRKMPPSPPTSIASPTSPITTRKRKAVSFSELCLESSWSVPKHRFYRKISGSLIAPYRYSLSKNQISQSCSLQNDLERCHELRKRPRLSLTTPDSAEDCNLDLSSMENSVQHSKNLLSPLNLKPEIRKKLAQFYYNPPQSQPTSPPALSPTLSTSIVSKRTALSCEAPKMLTADNEDEDGSSAESLSSDDVIASSLLPSNDFSKSDDRLNGLIQVGKSVRRAASFPRYGPSNGGLEYDREFEEDFERETRPILKNMSGKIFIADNVDQATRMNGRPRVSLDPLAPLAHRKAIEAVTSKALSSSTSKHTRSKSQVFSTGSFNNSISSTPDLDNILGSPSKRRRQSRVMGGLDVTEECIERCKIDSLLPFGLSDGLTSCGIENSVDAVEDCLIESVKTCLKTLLASLLPPPKEMRLDPISPLASWKTPVKRKLGQIGILLRSPSEPKDLLPCNLVNQDNSPIDSSIVTKSVPPLNQRLSLYGHISAVSKNPERVAPENAVNVNPPRTPEQSPSRSTSTNQMHQNAVITLREVEDAYVSFHDHFEALFHHWREVKRLDLNEQQAKVALLILDKESSHGLAECFVREIENLCKIDIHQSPTTQQVNNEEQFPVDFNHSSQPTPKSIISNSCQTPSEKPPDFFGSSTSQMRRRVAEIETGQAAMKCISLLWSMPGCVENFEESRTKKLLTHLVQVPDSTILRRRKNLTAIGLFNHVFKSQNLSPLTLMSHSDLILGAISKTLYLSIDRVGDKGRKVINLGIEALQKLATQIPDRMVKKIQLFIDPIFDCLTANDSLALRVQAVKILGILINFSFPGSKSAIQFLPDDDLKSCASGKYKGPRKQKKEDSEKLQKIKREQWRDKLSILALAFYNDKGTHVKWKNLSNQLLNSFNQGEYEWMLSAMGTLTLLLGARLRKLEPTATQSFMPFLGTFLHKEGPLKLLAQQIWDFYFHFMFIWSAENLNVKPDQVWALADTQLFFITQIFKPSYFHSNSPEKASQSCFKINSGSANVVEEASDLRQTSETDNLDGLGEASKAIDNTGSVSKSSGNSTASALELNLPRSQTSITNFLPKFKHEDRQCTLHRSLASFLYASLGFVHQNLKRAYSINVRPDGPQSWLEKVSMSPRFKSLDVIWDKVMAGHLQNILSGPVDDHRSYAIEILTALLKKSLCFPIASKDIQSFWSIDRLLHSHFHNPPLRADSVSEICLESFTRLANESSIKPREIPALDPLWICFRSKKVLSLILISISSMNLIERPEDHRWIYNQDGRRVITEPIKEIWTSFIDAINNCSLPYGDKVRPKISASVENLIETLEELLVGASIKRFDGHGSYEVINPNGAFISPLLLFKQLFLFARQNLANDAIQSALVSFSRINSQKVNIFVRLASFLLGSAVSSEEKTARFLFEEDDWREYEALIEMILNDLINKEQLTEVKFKYMGLAESDDVLKRAVEQLALILQGCSHDRLKFCFGNAVARAVMVAVKRIRDETDLAHVSRVCFLVETCLKATIESKIKNGLKQDFMISFMRFLSECPPGCFNVLIKACQRSIALYLANNKSWERETVSSFVFTS
ncbi:hypothetical protein BY996DRAFT_4599233 [Phakopsora pachyrhizi]|nr:hypothetical protein BY996DRAFT_4599233 [Phakopsora pachyrhizi]